ncbi:hypothetical protein LTR37_010110 [Vermiconidia calcicola]|uniref:Uncharacterized protein n=1 Tax=Vermiconidia calcicola TaxID=1690605 RepID=A0ACC3N6A8_9PEZI|nr:hypothetical protein LTR37_010110 [Vermiconidia calcicola]
MDIRTLGADSLLLADVMRRGLRATQHRLPNNATADDRALRAHDSTGMVSVMYSAWADMYRAFAMVEFLQIDLSNCYCPLGCHRLIEEAANAITMGFRYPYYPCDKATLPTELEILGIKSTQERSDIVDDIKEVLGIASYTKRKCILRFKVALRDTECDGEGLLLDSCDVEEGLEDEEIDLSTLDIKKDLEDDESDLSTVVDHGWGFSDATTEDDLITL